MTRYCIFLLVIPFLLLGCVPPSQPTATVTPPRIEVFSANPPRINAGAESQLLWNVTNATTVNIDQGIGEVPVAGARGVTPSGTIAYTITATNSAGSVTRSVVVAVVGSLLTVPAGQPPVISSFFAIPSEISPGNPAILIWDVDNADTVAIEPVIGSILASGDRAVYPANNTLFTLTATNSSGKDVRTTMVTVSNIAPTLPSGGMPVIHVFKVTPSTILKSKSATISWHVSNAVSVNIEPTIGNVGAVGTKSVSPTISTTYTLTAVGPSGVKISSVTLTVVPLLTPFPTLNPTFIPILPNLTPIGP